MTANLSALFYLISGILFILALRGLSSPETSRQGNYFGIAGMVISIIVTFLSVGNFGTGFIYVIIFLVIGGSVGAFIAYRIPMTAMPELVAGFHSLVGLAAVFVAISAFLKPEAFNLGIVGSIKLASLIEMSLGAAIGAITFSGSIIAFLKLRGIMSGSPITFSGQHFLNLALGIIIIFSIYYLCISQSSNIFWSIVLISFVLGVLLIIPIGGADMPVVISMLNSYSGWAAAGIGFTLENTALIITGALVGSSGAILSYIMCKGMNRSFFNVILGGFSIVHQFCHLGEHSFSAMGSAITKDVPPYVMVGGRPTKPHGINTVGLERRGFSPAAILKIKRAYKLLYKSGLKLSDATDQLKEAAKEQPELNVMVDFLGNSSRSILR